MKTRTDLNLGEVFSIYQSSIISQILELIFEWFSFSCVCPVIDHEFRHNIVKETVDPRGDSQVDLQATFTML